VGTVAAIMIAIFSVVGWPFVARGVRGIVAAEREREYVVAARAAESGVARDRGMPRALNDVTNASHRRNHLALLAVTLRQQQFVQDRINKPVMVGGRRIVLPSVHIEWLLLLTRIALPALAVTFKNPLQRVQPTRALRPLELRRPSFFVPQPEVCRAERMDHAGREERARFEDFIG
jgi:hypothetical protein